MGRGATQALLLLYCPVLCHILYLEASFFPFSAVAGSDQIEDVVLLRTSRRVIPSSFFFLSLSASIFDDQANPTLLLLLPARILFIICAPRSRSLVVSTGLFKWGLMKGEERAKTKERGYNICLATFGRGKISGDDNISRSGGGETVAQE